MSSTLPSWLDSQPGSTRARLRTILLLCVIFVVGFALTRGNPNAGLFLARGRLWLIAVGFFIFLVQASAVSPDEFAYYGSLGALPPPGSRLAAIITLVLAVLVWIGSLWDTWGKLQLETSAKTPTSGARRTPAPVDAACYRAVMALSPPASICRGMR